MTGVGPRAIHRVSLRARSARRTDTQRDKCFATQTLLTGRCLARRRRERRVRGIVELPRFFGHERAFAMRTRNVNGHQEFPTGGHLFSPAVAMFSPRWWP